MRKRRLPRRYARDFLRRTRSNFFSKSIGWKQFLSLMEQKEPTILRAYTTLCLSKSGTLHKNQILTSLRSAGLPANEDNAAAMLRYLNSDSEDQYHMAISATSCFYFLQNALRMILGMFVASC